MISLKNINNFNSTLKDNEIIRHHLGNEYDNSIQEKAGSFSGWRSPSSTSQHGNPECWSTALVFDCPHTMDIIAETNLNREILQELKGNSLKQNFARFRKRLDSMAVSNEELYI